MKLKELLQALKNVDVCVTTWDGDVEYPLLCGMVEDILAHEDDNAGVFGLSVMDVDYDTMLNICVVSDSSNVATIKVTSCWDCPYRRENKGGQVPHYCSKSCDTMCDRDFPKYCPLFKEV